ncbi:MAG: hypothetical protein IPP79_10110 [Chitinophagaceae bacterium]|nr:hypothetical protein [Chitinophagaceae bacterium]
MKAASVQELKQELKQLPPAQLVELCLRLSRFKKENKELLTYLLFEAHQEADFVKGIKEEIDDNFSEINRSHLYFAKKSLRKIVRIINKYCRYSNVTETELELRLYFCTTLKNSGIPINQNPVIKNLYNTQIKKSEQLIESLHEDLQYEFRREFKKLNA